MHLLHTYYTFITFPGFADQYQQRVYPCQEKIRHFRETSAASPTAETDTVLEDQFSDKEIMRLWNKMKTARKHYPTMQKTWDDAEKLGRGKAIQQPPHLDVHRRTISHVYYVSRIVRLVSSAFVHTCGMQF